MKDILTARREAGTPRGVEYANRLEAMPPDQAADEIYDMFQLCADEDLACEISCDLQLHPKAAMRISIAIVRKRAAESDNHETARANEFAEAPQHKSRRRPPGKTVASEMKRNSA